MRPSFEDYLEDLGPVEALRRMAAYCRQDPSGVRMAEILDSAREALVEEGLADGGTEH